MLIFENIETCNWKAAIRGMRNPKNSWDKSDSVYSIIDGVMLGPNDLKLMKQLANAGTDHSKFLRMITVSFDVIAPLYWWKEFDTYKIGTVRNSCSTMHKIESKELELKDFAFDGLTIVDKNTCLMHTITYLNQLIKHYQEAKSNDEKRILHQRIVKLLPDGYLQRATITTNYQVLRAIRNSERKTHKLDEWKFDFMKFIDSLPYANELLVKANKVNKNEGVQVPNDCPGCGLDLAYEFGDIRLAYCPNCGKKLGDVEKAKRKTRQSECSQRIHCLSCPLSVANNQFAKRCEELTEEEVDVILTNAKLEEELK